MSDTKKLANLIDQTTGIPLNPFWTNTANAPSELEALKNSYPKDGDNILQLLHDDAITKVDPSAVEVACCPHDMNGLLKDKATINAHIWGSYNDQYSGTLWYNDLTNKEVGPLNLQIKAHSSIEENNDAATTNHNELNIENNNLFNVIMPWDLYWAHSGINFAKVVNEWKLEANPVAFMNIKRINIIKGKTYRIYCGNLISTQPSSGLNAYLSISFQGSLDSFSWEYIYDADGQPFDLDFNDFQIAGTGYKYRDIVFNESYNYLRVVQKASGVEFPSKNNGLINWPTAGGEYFPYISEIEFLGIGLASELSVYDDTTTSGFVIEGDSTKTLLNIDDTILNLRDYLVPSEPLNFIYKTKISDNLYSYLEHVGNIINQQETLSINKILIKPTVPSIRTITYNSVTLYWSSHPIDLPSNASVNVCISKSSDLVPLYSEKVAVGGGVQEITFTDLEENTSYYLFTNITASKNVENSNDDHIYFNSDVRRFTTPSSTISCNIKFYSKVSPYGTYWVNYPNDNGNILINRRSQLIAWTSELEFYNPLNKNDTGGYFLEVTLSPESHWATITDIKMEGTLEYEYTTGDNITESTHCLLQSKVGATALWQQSTDEGTIYGTSFKYTYGNGGVTGSLGHDDEYSAMELADKLDTIKITIKGRDAAGNTLQYTTTYPVYAPILRASRD